MRASVRAAFAQFTERFESALPWMYLDVLGKVTTGYGNLIDWPAAATALPWRRADGSLAGRDEILADWARIKAAQESRSAGGVHYQHLARLRLDPAGVRACLDDKLATNDTALRQRFVEFETWPADAQLAVHSLSWACGAQFRFPKLEAALRAKDFAAGAGEIEMSAESNPGNDLRRRNAANKTLMQNAALGTDPAVLYYPTDLAAAPLRPVSGGVLGPAAIETHARP